VTRAATLGDLLEQRAAEHPGAPALTMADGAGWVTWSFQQLHDASHRMAAALASEGVRQGDRVLMLMKPSHRFYATVFALGLIGATPVLVDPGMGAKRLLECIEQIAPRVVIALSAVHAVRVLYARRAFRTAEVIVTDGARWFWGGSTVAGLMAKNTEGTRFSGPAVDPTDAAAIVFTSGSTGTPKGVRFEHGMFVGATRTLAAGLGLGPGMVTLETFAAFVLIDVALGMTAVVPDMDLSKPAQADPAKLLRAIEEHRPQVAFASPIVLRKIIERATSSGVQLPTLRTVISGVAPVPGALHQRLRAVAPNVNLAVNYGATEALTVTHVGSDEVLGETWARAGRGDGTCVGRLFPEMALRIVGIHDGPLPSDAPSLVDGAIGEILVAGPVVSPEYVDRPDANTIAKVRDRSGTLWHRTGDLGWRDPQGRLWFAGRVAHRVETADGMLPSVPVEGVFDDHPGVRWTALVGVGGPPEEPVLCVELEPGATLDDAGARALLARADGTRWAGRVRAILLVPRFPVDARHNAKIRREDLRAHAAQNAGSIRRVP
jgi:acyl-CoA synthetase (AMP-forming)/AMP-acid ligase II